LQQLLIPRSSVPSASPDKLMFRDMLLDSLCRAHQFRKVSRSVRDASYKPREGPWDAGAKSTVSKICSPIKAMDFGIFARQARQGVGRPAVPLVPRYSVQSPPIPSCRPSQAGADLGRSFKIPYSAAPKLAVPVVLGRTLHCSAPCEATFPQQLSRRQDRAWRCASY
jgi:hypothetical protein